MDHDQEWNSQSEPNGHDDQRYPQQAIAVVGVACRFSGADSVEQLWEILETGSSQCSDLPKHRFPDSCFERRNFKRDFRANVMDDVDAFDHKFFSITSREAGFRDPQQRMALEVTYQALESAGYFARETTEEDLDMGCYMATSNNEYHENVCTHAPSAFSLTGSIRPFIAGQVSHHFGFTGPSIMLDAACAASGVAINIACRAVASGECQSAIVGATNLFITPDTFQNLAYGHFTSPTGPSKSFDAAADGYGRGEGVAVIVIKKLSDALRDGDVVRGVIASTAVNQCATGGSITVPHGPSQSALYRKALQLANLDADQIGYVEAHGTGTRVGDPIEAESIREVFGNANRAPGAETYMGSLKSNIGHTEATAGLSGLIKAMLMIEKSLIPQQALFNRLNPQIAPLEPSGLKIPTRNIDWTSARKIACVNNYGASGSNAVMILMQAPLSQPREVGSRIHNYPVCITAFSESSLRSYCSALLQFMAGSDTSTDLAPDLAFHLSRRRNPELPFSCTGTVSSVSELRKLLASAQSGTLQHRSNSICPVVLFFGGQDGETPSISRALYDSCTVLRKHLDECDRTLQTLGHDSILPSIFESDGRASNSVLVHSKLFSVQYASAKAWMDCGLRPARLVGHSFGQLTALAVSGVLSLPDALGLVTTRARLIDEKWGPDSGAMVAIEATPQEVTELLAQHADLNLEVACFNGERSMVLAGPVSSVDSFESLLKASRTPHRFKRLQTSNAFHSALAEPLIEALQGVVQGLTIQAPKIPLETCSERNTWSSIDPQLIASHIREPVYFHHAVQRIADQLGACTWIEAGCGTNTSLLRRALEPHASSHRIKAIRLNADDSLERLADMTADLWRWSFKVQFWPFHQDQRYDYRILNLPSYQFDKTRHWMQWQETSTPSVVAVPSASQPKPLLSLVHKTETSCRFEINTACVDWRNSCTGHLLLGCSVCPISLLLNLLSQAAERCGCASMQEKRIDGLQHIKFLMPVPAETDGSFVLEIDMARPAPSWSFSLSNAQHAFATGALCDGEPEEHCKFVRFERLVDVARARKVHHDPLSERIRGRGLYKICAGKFQFPKARQIVLEVAVKGDEAAASLGAMPENPSAATETLVQIPLICLNGLFECPDDEIFVNTAIGNTQSRKRPHSATEQGASTSVYLRFFELETSRPTCDMYVFDTHDGKLCMVILDMAFARRATKSIHEALLNGTPVLLSPAADSRVLEEIPAASIKSDSTEYGAKSRFSDDEVLHSQDRDSFPDLTQALFDLLARVVDVDPNILRADVSLADLGIDSLMLMEVTDEINKTFATNIDMTDLLVTEDLAAVCQLIAKQTSEYLYNPTTGSASVLSTIPSSVGTDISSNTEFSTDEGALKEICGVPKNKLLLDTALEAFDEIRRDFDHLAKEAGCDKFWSEIHPFQTRLIEAYILEALINLGCDVVSLKPGDKIPSIPHRAGTEKLLRQLLVVLQDTGLINASGTCWYRTNKCLPKSASSSQLFQDIQIRFPKWAPEHELLHVAGANLTSHFQGVTNPVKVFFGTAERRQLMADQYLVAPIQSTVSRQLARFVENCFRCQMSERPVMVLEVGGGTCGTTLPVLEALARAGVRVEYTFTDISQSFVAAAKSKLGDYDFVKYRALDISAEPSAEWRNSYDVIFATNVIHATPDAGKSASNVRKLLREGGFLAMVEYTDIYAAGDVIFGQFDGWWLFDDGRSHAIMNEVEWDKTLRRAGFVNVDWTGSDTRESQIARIFLAS